MVTVKDAKGLVYKLLDQNVSTTLLECLTTGMRVRIRNNGWDEIGFVKP